MGKVSAGLVMYRIRDGQLQFLLVHPGGPFWAKKDVGAWFIPKGEVNPGEDLLQGAKREFAEETGLSVEASFVALGSVKHKSGKTVYAWAFHGDCDPNTIKSNTFTLEWPPKSKQKRQFPEIDRAAFLTLEQAQTKMHPDEFALLQRLSETLARTPTQNAS